MSAPRPMGAGRRSSAFPLVYERIGTRSRAVVGVGRRPLVLVVLYECCTGQLLSDTARSCALVGSSCAVTVPTARPTTGPWSSLERTLILSQPYAWPHTKAHALMRGQAVRDRGGRETTGQVVYMIVAGPGSLVGRFPFGNTGALDDDVHRGRCAVVGSGRHPSTCE